MFDRYPAYMGSSIVVATSARASDRPKLCVAGVRDRSKDRGAAAGLEPTTSLPILRGVEAHVCRKQGALSG